MFKNKKLLLVLGIIILLAITLLFLRGEEDSWIKNEKGIYIEHGKPREKPDYVSEQEKIVVCALQLYQQKKQRE